MAFNQNESVERLHKNVRDTFANKFPVEYNGYTFNVSDIVFETPNGDYEEQKEAFLNDGDLKTNVRGVLTAEKEGEKTIQLKNVLFATIPYVTDRGTYILGGNEKVFLNQMVLRPGLYVAPAKTLSNGTFIQSTVRAGRQRFTMTFNMDKGDLTLEGLGIDFGYGGKKVNAISFLRFIGATEQEIKEAIGDENVYSSLMANSRSVTPEKVFKAVSEKEYPGVDEAKEVVNQYLQENLTFNEIAQKVSKEMVGESFSHVDKDALLATIKQMMKEYKTPDSTPDMDDIRFKEVYSSEDVIAVRGLETGINTWIKRLKERVRQNNIKSTTIKPERYIQTGLNSLYKSNLSEGIDSPNPLDLHQKLHKLTISGTGGLSTDSASEANRNLQDTAFSKIDPVETPQSQMLGITQHLAKDAVIKNGTIYSTFYRVKDGAIDHSKKIQDIDPLDEFNEYIAFNNPTTIEEKDGKWALKEGTIRVRHKGDFVEVDRSKVTLMDHTPSSHLGHAVGLVPFGAHNDGARMLMGSTMQRQALSLEDPDEPLVQSVSDAETGKTMEEEMANNASFLLRSPVKGTVSDIQRNFIEITSDNGEKTKVKKLNYFPAGKMGGFINHKPTVKVGDKVEEDGLLADGWQSKNGKMSLGKNVNVAYMPFDGYNFEDGVVVSESFAAKMASEEVKTIEYTIDLQEGSIPPEETKQRLKELLVNDEYLNKLDGNGVIKRGEKISAGDILVGYVKKRKKEEASKAERILNRSLVTTAKDIYINASKYAQGYQKGEIIDVDTILSASQLKVSIKLLSFKPMEEGDKLSGRHGNKGTITKILPDAEMPHTEDGEAVELIFSPLAVPSRKNLGQLLEVNAGLVARKKGMNSYNIQNFNANEREKLMKDLEEIGVPDGKQTLINPTTGKPYENKVTVGPMYIMKLKHKVEGKISARNFGDDDPVTGMPMKKSGSIDGERHSPQGIGGMEFWSLTSAGAVNNIHEMTTLKSDGSGSAKDRHARVLIYEAIRHGERIPKPVTPETLKVLQEELYGAGIQMTPLKGDKEVSIDEKFSSLMLQPLSKKKIEELAPVAVEKSQSVEARTGKFFPDGLYGENIFGEKGDKWGKIELESPIPHPLYLSDQTGPKPYEAMLASKGIKNKKLIEVVENGKYIVLDPKGSDVKKYSILTAEEVEDLVDIEGEDIVVETGGRALEKLLGEVNLKEELSLAEERLKTAKNATERSKAHNQVRVLSGALDKGYEPQDYMMTVLPVLPVKYRQPIRGGGDDTVIEDGITKLYENFMKKSKELDRALEAYDGDHEMIDRETYSKLQAARYERLKNIVGVGSPYIDKKTNMEYKGILHRTSSKQGFLREKMQKKLQDYSGRSVIIVDPVLEMDEVALPEDMAAEMFRPKIEAQLFKERYEPKEIQAIIKKRGEEFRRALDKSIEDEVVILNRQPSLHRHSLQAFKPIIRWNGDDKDSKPRRAIGLNPIVTTGFNADFDGDTMAVHLPITEAAKKEAKEKLMPSKNLLNPTNNGLIMELKHEMQLGLYYMTRDKAPSGTPKKFKDYNELKKAYIKGEVGTYDAVEMNVPTKGMIKSTAGAHLFNMALPPQFIDYSKNINMKKGKMEELLNNIIEDKRSGPMEAVRVINELKNTGFKTATYSGMSIGVKDFDPVASINKEELFKEAEKSLGVSNFIDKREEFEQEKTNYVNKRIQDMIKDGVLDADNPVEIMRASGSRGNAGQISSMSGIIGVGKDVTSRSTRPVNHSLLEGTSPDEFWDLSSDSRKGIYDRSVASQKPGELTRYVWLTNKQTIITEKDCGDSTGTVLDMNDASDAKSLRGRVLLKDVALKGGGVIRAKKEPLSIQEVEKIRTSAAVKSDVHVRSPLSCKTTQGICQLCYGTKPGAMQNELVPIGEAVGSIAAQALGEPSQQAIMKTFHTGAGTSNLSGAFDNINNVLSLNSNMPNKAVLAQKEGIVTAILKDPVIGTTVVVDNKKYKLGQKPIADGLKIGAKVEAGDELTKLFDGTTAVTVKDPRDVLKYEGVQATKDHLTRQIENAFKSGDINDIDRRHMEITVNNMTNRAVVDNGGTSSFNTEDRASMKVLEQFNNQSARIVTTSLDYRNRMNVIGAKAGADYNEGIGGFGAPIVKKGEVITEAKWEKLKTNQKRKHIKVVKQNVSYTPELQNVKQDTKLMNENWLEHAARGNATNIMGKGSANFMEDKLDNPLTRQMTGQKGNFGEGFGEWKDSIQDRFGGLFI